MVPALEVPVENVKTPLVPDAPAFALLAETPPLFVAVPVPLTNDNTPPAAFAEVLPAVSDS